MQKELSILAQSTLVPGSLLLFHYPFTRSTRCLWTLLELFPEQQIVSVKDANSTNVSTDGTPFRIKHVELTRGEMFTPDMLRINPNHALPVLQYRTLDKDGEERSHTMFESGAICLFLADYYASLTLPKDDAPRPLLIPPPTAASDRADCLMMLFFGTCHMDTLLWDLRINVDFLTNEDGTSAGCSEIVIARAKQKWNDEVIPQLVERLTAHPFVCAFGFSVADIIIGYNLGWARKPAYKLAPYPPVIRAYLNSLASRPAFRQAYRGNFVDVGPQFKARFFPKL